MGQRLGYTVDMYAAWRGQLALGVDSPTFTHAEPASNLIHVWEPSDTPQAHSMTMRSSGGVLA